MIDFLNVLPLLNPQDFEAMHTVTSIFEQLALYLVCIYARTHNFLLT